MHARGDKGTNARVLGKVGYQSCSCIDH